MITNSKILKPVAILLIGSIFLASCASTTMIHSEPSGAQVFIDDEHVGETPYEYKDKKIVGTCLTVRLEKEGYNPFYSSFCRDEEANVGAIIGGFLVLVPYLWAMNYKPIHRYELTPKVEEGQGIDKEKEQKKTKAERLRELKRLLDENILTQEEFEKEKKKILEEDER
ncbi:PEGA domain-containing protein [Halocola ammonii]